MTLRYALKMMTTTTMTAKSIEIVIVELLERVTLESANWCKDSNRPNVIRLIKMGRV